MKLSLYSIPITSFEHIKLKLHNFLILLKYGLTSFSRTRDSLDPIPTLHFNNYKPQYFEISLLKTFLFYLTFRIKDTIYQILIFYFSSYVRDTRTPLKDKRPIL